MSNLVIPSQDIIGQAFSIAGLAIVAPLSLFFHHYSRSLDFAQILYVFSICFSTIATVSFSSYLNYSWLSFMPQFISSKYCTVGDYSCTYGNLLDPGIVWAGGAVFFFILIKLIACKKRQAKFLSFYNFYKGFMRWFMPPLVYFSTGQVIIAIQSSNFTNNAIAAVIVLAFFVVLSIVELVGYKMGENEETDKWRKWIEFINQWNIATVMMFVSVAQNVTSTTSFMKYLVNIPLGIYFIIYLIKYKFTFKVFERIIFIIQEAIIIAILNVFLIDYTLIINYNLDFFALAVVIAIELILFIPKLVVYCKNGNDQEAVINPEKQENMDQNIKKKNSFARVQEIDNSVNFHGQKSTSLINQSSVSSPKPKVPAKRR